MRKIGLVMIFVLLATISACSKAGNGLNPASGMQIATVAGTLEHVVPGAATPTSVSIKPDSSPILLFDDFSDPGSGWDISSDEYGKAGYDHGKYLIEAIKKENYKWGQPHQNFSDVYIVVDVNVVSTNSEYDDGFGVDCRVQENSDSYGFRISSQGAYKLMLYKDTEAITLIDWTQSSAIKTDGTTNQLIAICQGNELTFLVNGVELAKTNDNTYSEGDIALSAISYQTDPVTVTFDNLTVYRPGN